MVQVLSLLVEMSCCTAVGFEVHERRGGQ
jgi:hypothetical protein